MHLPPAQVYTQLLADVVMGRDLREAVMAAAADVGVDLQRVLRYNYTDEEVVQRVFGSACYITDSMPWWVAGWGGRWGVSGSRGEGRVGAIELTWMGGWVPALFGVVWYIDGS